MVHASNIGTDNASLDGYDVWEQHSPLTLEAALHRRGEDAEIFRNELAYRSALDEARMLEGWLIAV